MVHGMTLNGPLFLAVARARGVVEPEFPILVVYEYGVGDSEGQSKGGRGGKKPKPKPTDGDLAILRQIRRERACDKFLRDCNNRCPPGEREGTPMCDPVTGVSFCPCDVENKDGKLPGPNF